MLVSVKRQNINNRIQELKALLARLTEELCERLLTFEDVREFKKDKKVIQMRAMREKIADRIFELDSKHRDLYNDELAEHHTKRIIQSALDNYLIESNDNVINLYFVAVCRIASGADNIDQYIYQGLDRDVLIMSLEILADNE